MTLTKVPTNIYRVYASNSGTVESAVFTSRDEARSYRRFLRNQGWSANDMTTTRFTVGSPEEVAV